MKDFPLYIDMQGQTALLAECNGLVRYNGMVRELTNRPANFCTPSDMAADMKAAADRAGVNCEILDERQVEALGMQAFLAVGQSTAHPLRLIVLRYEGSPDNGERIALVGKGITCDTGGYCNKPGGSMQGIRGDMAGGAAVCGALLMLAEQKVPVNAVAVIPAAENRISRESYIPGDVIGSMAGKSIFIGNTDAEGRLLLADAITYAIQKEKATRVVDVATLTGACYNFFGHVVTGFVSSEDALAQRLQEAAAQSAEKVWRIPAEEEYAEMLKTPYADISNLSAEGCGMVTAAMFIKEFTEGLPWAHLDIAGTAWVDSPKLEYHTTGATGVMVETLYRLCRSYGASK